MNASRIETRDIGGPAADDGPIGTMQYWLIGLLSLNYGLVFIDRNALSILMPYIRSDLQLSGAQIGMLASALSVTWSMAAFLLGSFSDRTGRRKALLLGSTLVFSACSALAGLAGGFVSLLGIRLSMGVAEGGVLPISLALIARAVPGRRRGLAMGITQNLGSSLLGSFVAPLLLVALAERFGWRHAFQLSALPGFVIALLLWRVVGADHAPEIGATAKPRVSVREALAHRNVILCGLIAVCCVAFFLVAMTFLPIYLVQVRGMAPASMGWLLAVLGISSTANSILVPAIADRIGRKPPLIAGALLGLLIPAAALFYHGSSAGLAVLFLLGWMPISLFPLFMGAIPAETVGARQAATVIGLIMAIGECVGGICAPTLAGFASDAFGLAAPMWILAGLCVSAALLSCGVRETRVMP